MARGRGYEAMIKEAPDKEESELIEFDFPRGFSPPEDAEYDRPFDVTAGLILTEDGKLRLASINGIPFSEEEVEAAEDELNDEEVEMEGEPQSLEEAMRASRPQWA